MPTLETDTTADAARAAIRAARKLENASVRAGSVALRYLAGVAPGDSMESQIIAVKGAYDRLTVALRRLRRAARG